jgi:putative N6-adenine-specific DNA methylase
MEKLFAVCAPGLEPYTALELIDLGLLPGSQEIESKASGELSGQAGVETGGVNFAGDLKAIYLANLYLRTASRVLVRLGDFHAAAFSELRKKASRLAWERFLKPGQPLVINVTCHRSRLYHSDAVAERIAGAIGDCLGKPPVLIRANPDESQVNGEQNLPPQLLVVRLVENLCTISIDSSGDLLHRRGYRLATAKAPLRETLAAGLLMASRWDRISPLVDPFCGSGTIVIEAAMMALGIAPGQARHFSFMDWQHYDPMLWELILKEYRFRMEERKSEYQNKFSISGSDRDAGAVKMAQANASRIGVDEFVEFSCRAVSAIETSGTGWVVTNPPYGLRVSAGKDLRNLYAQFGKVLKVKCPDWHVAILCSDFRLIRSMDLQLESGISLVNGGVPVRLAQGVVRV